MPNLYDLSIKELSLVAKAANKRRWLIMKSEEEGGDMPEIVVKEEHEKALQEFASALAEGKGDVLKSLSSLEADDLALMQKAFEATDIDEELKKMDMAPEDKKAISVALKALKSVKAMPKDLMASLHKLGGVPMIEEKGKPNMEKDTMKKSDGSVDLSALPEDVQAVFKANEEAIAKAEQEKAEAKAELEKIKKEARDAEYLAKAKEFDKLATKDEVLASILEKSNSSLSADEYSELERILRSANETSKEVFKSAGKDGDVIEKSASEIAEEKFEVLVKAYQAEANVSYEAAFAKMYEIHTDLAKELK